MRNNLTMAKRSRRFPSIRRNLIGISYVWFMLGTCKNDSYVRVNVWILNSIYFSIKPMTNRMIRENKIAITMGIYFSGIEQMGPTFSNGFLNGLHLNRLTALRCTVLVKI